MEKLGQEDDTGSQRRWSRGVAQRLSVMGLLTLVGSFVLCFLLIFRASTWACLFCFTTNKERLSLCQKFVGKNTVNIQRCIDAFSSAFENLQNIEINYEERNNLNAEFAQMIIYLREVAISRGSYQPAFHSAAEKMSKTIQHLKKARDCVPPCGIQEVTRRFHCWDCFSTICDLPLDCPVQDLLVKRGDQALFSCIVAFQLPESEVTYSWKHAGGGLRTRDVNFFRDLPGAHGYLARIRPVKPSHSGTFTCVIKHDRRPLARLYFYLNVTGPPPAEDTELQATFREVINWRPEKEEELSRPWKPTLGELLRNPEALTVGNLFLIATIAALGSSSVSLLVWLFLHWYLSGN